MLDLVELLFEFACFALAVYFGLKSKGLKLITGIIVISFILPFIGGFLWYVICNIFNWNDLSIGTGGQKALLWGVITISPVSLFFACTVFVKKSKKVKQFKFKFRLLPFIGGILIALFAGIGAYLFYNIDFRNMLITCSLSSKNIEFAVIIIWSMIISGFGSIILLFKKFELRNSSISSVIAIPIITGLICFIGMKVYNIVITNPLNDPSFIIRGIMAGFCLRFGFFYGILFSFDKKAYHSLSHEIKIFFKSTFNYIKKKVLELSIRLKNKILI